MKRCPRCGVVRDTTEFSSATRNKDGLQCWCKDCCSKQRKPGINSSVVRKGICICCGKEFILLSSKRIYCSNNCRSEYNSISKNE